MRFGAIEYRLLFGFTVEIETSLFLPFVLSHRVNIYFKYIYYNNLNIGDKRK